MKKILSFSFIAIFTLTMFSCKKENKTSLKEVDAPTYTIDATHSTLQWTAYKTTDKVPVKGTFKEINILKADKGASASDALNGLEFKIPVASIFSNDTLRDGKLNKFFFAVMENTVNLKGHFSVQNENSGKLEITMNGLSKELPFSYEMSKDTILLQATMNLNVWQTQKALASLHEACFEMHTGPDGVSKTWDEVGISAKILTVEN